MKRRFVTVLVLLALCVGFALPVGAYDEARPLPALTGDQAKDIVAIAISQLGYTENNGTVYGAWWETQITWEHDYTHEAWCGMFAAWCADKAGAGMGKAYDNNAALANGIGDVRYPTVVNLLTLWAFRIPLGNLILHFFDGRYAIAAIPISFGFGLVSMLFFYRSHRWKEVCLQAKSI